MKSIFRIDTVDSKALRSMVEVTNSMPDAHYVKIVESHYLEQGLAVEEKLMYHF